MCSDVILGGQPYDVFFSDGVEEYRVELDILIIFFLISFLSVIFFFFFFLPVK